MSGDFESDRETFRASERPNFPPGVQRRLLRYDMFHKDKWPYLILKQNESWKFKIVWL